MKHSKANIIRLIAVALLLAVPFSVSAKGKWIPTYTLTGSSPAYVAQGGALAASAEGYLAFGSNPAGLVAKDEVIHYSLDTWFTSDVQTLELLANPSVEVESLARRISETIVAMPDAQAQDFWKENPDLISQLASLDGNFPVLTSDPAFNAYTIKQYFQNEFLQSDYGAARWGQAVIAFADPSTEYPFFGSIVPDPRAWLGGNFRLGLSMGTSRIKDGFGWAFGLATEFRTGNSLLSPHEGKFDVSLSFPLGYAFHATPSISIGFGLRTEIRINTDIPNSNFLNARFEDNIVNLFSEPFYFGAGFGVDFGLSYDQSDALRFAFVIRNLPALQRYLYTPLTELAEIGNGKWPKFTDDENIYFVPTDIAIGGRYRFIGAGGHEYDLSLEVSNVMSQLILGRYYPGRKFYVDDVVKVGLDIKLNEAVQLMVGYGNQFVSFGVVGDTPVGTYSASLSARILRFEAGPSFGVNFRMQF